MLEQSVSKARLTGRKYVMQMVDHVDECSIWSYQ
jgi:hypothetical protein